MRFRLLQEQETLSFIRENLEKSDQLTKGMVVDTHAHAHDHAQIHSVDRKLVKSPFNSFRIEIKL